MDMGKFKYDAQKKANKAKKKQKKIDLKEIKLRPVTEVHDYSFKIKNAQKFLWAPCTSFLEEHKEKLYKLKKFSVFFFHYHPKQ